MNICYPYVNSLGTRYLSTFSDFDRQFSYIQNILIFYSFRLGDSPQMIRYTLSLNLFVVLVFIPGQKKQSFLMLRLGILKLCLIDHFQSLRLRMMIVCNYVMKAMNCPLILASKKIEAILFQIARQSLITYLSVIVAKYSRLSSIKIHRFCLIEKPLIRLSSRCSNLIYISLKTSPFRLMQYILLRLRPIIKRSLSLPSLQQKQIWYKTKFQGALFLVNMQREWDMTPSGYKVKKMTCDCSCGLFLPSMQVQNMLKLSVKVKVLKDQLKGTLVLPIIYIVISSQRQMQLSYFWITQVQWQGLRQIDFIPVSNTSVLGVNSFINCLLLQISTHPNISQEVSEFLTNAIQHITLGKLSLQSLLLYFLLLDCGESHLCLLFFIFALLFTLLVALQFAVTLRLTF